MDITLVTGNQGKLNEWKRFMPSGFTVTSEDIDLDEIQSLNSEDIVADKAKRAYEVVKGPVIVEDVSAGLEKLHGLPGPFIKFFIKVLGEDALMKLAEAEGDKATVSCIVAYYDGKTMLTLTGSVDGTVVQPRGENGFGFDKVFVPNGTNKTYGEMTPEEKDAVSHRSKAIRMLAAELALLKK